VGTAERLTDIAERTRTRKGSEMKNNMSPGTPAQWTTPVLTYRGSVGQILQGGGGKLSISGSDPGEGRCEKPHASDCDAAAKRGGGSGG
jgi:hypothetical protein